MKQFLIILLVLIPLHSLFAQESKPTTPLDTSRIPSPVFDEEPGYVALYWNAWELAWDHVHTDSGAPQSPFVDEAFSDGAIWIWDTEFMVLFCKYAFDYFPGIQSLSNFYGPMHDLIPSSQKIVHPDNPPFFAWIEWNYYLMTGDTSRVTWLLKEHRYLQKHFAWFEKERRVNNVGYSWGGNESGMDNTSRGRGKKGTMLWLDALAQQCLSALYISRLAEVIDADDIHKEYSAIHKKFKKILQRYYWDDKDNFYYDVDAGNRYRHLKVMTPASYWPLLAEAATRNQAAAMVHHALNQKIFYGYTPFTTVSISDPSFNPTGQYWLGSSWLPTTFMAIKALDRYGFHDETTLLSRKMIDAQYRTYRSVSPHTIWECYSPTDAKPATEKPGTGSVRKDFCGWSALGPISLFIENVIGIQHIDAPAKRIAWNIRSRKRHGIRRLRFGTTTTDLLCANGMVTVQSTSPYTLVCNGVEHSISKGTTTCFAAIPTIDKNELTITLASSKGIYSDTVTYSFPETSIVPKLTTAVYPVNVGWLDATMSGTGKTRRIVNRVDASRISPDSRHAMVLIRGEGLATIDYTVTVVGKTVSDKSHPEQSSTSGKKAR